MDRRLSLGQLIAGIHKAAMNGFNIANLTFEFRADALGVLQLVPGNKFLRDIE